MGRPKKNPEHPRDEMKSIPLDKILPPAEDVRLKIDPDKLDELVSSIRSVGLIEPITVKPRGVQFEIISGHRRFLAHRALKRLTIQSVVRDWDEKKIEAARLLENIDREGLSPWEEAIQLEKYKKRHKLTGVRLSSILGKSQAWISQRLAITKYPDLLKEALSAEKISFSVARELARIENARTLQEYTFLAMENGITPALAKRWADDANMMDQPVRPETAPGQAPVSIEEPQTPGQTCFMDGNFHPFSNINPVWICSQCRKLLLQAAKEMQQEALPKSG